MARALLALLAAAAMAACTGSSQPPTGPAYDQFGCQLGCARCAPEAECISSPYLPACLPRCGEGYNCAPGEKCTVLVGRDDADSTVCVAPTTLTVCHDPGCQIAPRCRDDMTQLKPLPQGFTACGWEVVHCDSGCDNTSGNCK